MIVEFEGFKFNKKIAVYQEREIIPIMNEFVTEFVEEILGRSLRLALEVSDFVKVRKVSEEK